VYKRQVFASIVAIIAILGILIAYGISQNQLFPPYQEPVAKCPMGFGNQNQEPAKEDITWPFPTGSKP
jgi:energy-converting hydrogenase Eha subunit F